MTRTRAERRHETAKRKAHARRIAKHTSLSIEESSEEWANKNADHLTKCSCPLCGNPRRHFGQKTRQEQKPWS